MSQEIYYTSAPSGMKRGASGFCTVAASDNMPRGLLERLEALSAYRHHFPAQSNGQNPVSEAHWMLNVSGTAYHVLSRVCDSGVDHTQRTNAFAHHLVLDTADMAAGGPAWMLESPGAMMRAWDGRVGAIAPRRLPRGDVSPAICRAWAAAAGDPGWGGHLADIFVKAPSKPVCILFAPGQEVLPLIAESIALLPAAARWNVTFNTYFTSMPTSATCVWRCCLADTPAAIIALRYAAGGVIINLTDTARLGQAPSGPYVTLAHTGQPPAGVIRAAAGAAPSVPRPAAGIAVKPPPRKNMPAKMPDVEEEIPEETSTYDIAATAAAAAENGAPAAGSGLPLPASKRPLVKHSMTSMRQADAALLSAQGEESQAAARRRQQVMLMFAGAVGALAVGTLLVGVLLHGGGPPSESDLTNGTSQPKPMPSSGPAPVVIASNPAPVMVPGRVSSEPASQSVVVVPPPFVTTAPVFVAPPVGPHYPGVVTLDDSLLYPSAGVGIADRMQTLAFKKADLDKIAPRSIHFSFPNGKAEYAVKGALAGEFVSSAAEKRGGTHTITITWKDSADLDIANVTFDRAEATVAVTWKTSAMVKRPEVVRLAYWLMQGSALELEARKGKNQQIVFKAPEIAVVQLMDASTALGKVYALPPDASVIAPTTLPPGWQVIWYTQWDTKDAALKDPASATQVLKFRKPGAGVVEAWFVLKFTPEFAAVESNFASRLAADQADLAQAQSDLRAITADIKERETNAGIKDTDPALAPFQAKKTQTAQIVDAYKAAVAGYKDITDIDVAINLPDGLHLTTVRFHQEAK